MTALNFYPDTRVARLDFCGCGHSSADHTVRHGRDRRGCAICALCRDYDSDNEPDAAAKILRRLGASDPLLTERAVAEFVREINRWRDAWAQVKVDKDREVRAAFARALDCADHGRIIAGLEKQLYAVDTTYRTTNEQRVLLVQSYWELRDTLTAIRKQIADGVGGPTTDRLLDLIVAVLSEALIDHDRVQPPKKRRPKQQALFEMTS